jgi:predicted AAA+ superfamily ATPase
MDLPYTLAMIIKRAYQLNRIIKANKVLVIYGPRRVGKTTLLNHFLASTKLKYKLDSGDNIRVQQVLSSQDFTRILEYVSGYRLLAIDEAQQIPNIGMGLKIIVDQVPDIMVIATGSSSFDLAGAVGEPLTGRKTTLTLFPVAQQELLSVYNRHELREKLEDFLVFGSYPEVVTARHRQDKIALLDEIVGSYLLKDILSLDRIKGAGILLDLLKLIAFQVGSLVSLNELATQIRLDVKTVGRYLDIFEKAFVIKRIGGFSRNLRKEVVSKAKYYFLDNGIRNAVISQFNSLDNRNDIGALWENFMVTERLKKCAYQNLPGSFHFWRTYGGQEIDLVEEREGHLFGYELKWAEKKGDNAPKDWSAAYTNSSFKIIHQGNYLDFIL